jgi:hypothetical protein
MLTSGFQKSLISNLIFINKKMKYSLSIKLFLLVIFMIPWPSTWSQDGIVDFLSFPSQEHNFRVVSISC